MSEEQLIRYSKKVKNLIVMAICMFIGSGLFIFALGGLVFQSQVFQIAEDYVVTNCGPASLTTTGPTLLWWNDNVSITRPNITMTNETINLLEYTPKYGGH